jgi:hypothetical protein
VGGSYSSSSAVRLLFLFSSSPFFPKPDPFSLFTATSPATPKLKNSALNSTVSKAFSALSDQTRLPLLYLLRVEEDLSPVERVWRKRGRLKLLVFLLCVFFSSLSAVKMNAQSFCSSQANPASPLASTSKAAQRGQSVPTAVAMASLVSLLPQKKEVRFSLLSILPTNS